MIVPRIRQRPGRAEQAPAHSLVRLVTRLMVAQTVAAAAVGLPFSRRQLPAVIFTLVLVAVLCLLALTVRTGTRGGWLAALGFETVFFVYGLSRFVVARYVGGTLFALVVACALLHPAVARAYSVELGRRARPSRDEIPQPSETFSEGAMG